MSDPIQIEGIILDAKIYQQHDCLLTLFSKDEGIIPAFVKHGYRNKHRLRMLLVPLTEVELICVRGYEGLYLVSDGSLRKAYTHIRSKELTLFAASQMAQALKQMLWQHQAAPAVYSLFCYYLQALQTFPSPEVLLWSFWFKLLKHEGKFFPHAECSICKQMLTETVSFAHGELICSHHKTEEIMPLTLDIDQVIVLIRLTHSRTLEELHSIAITPPLREKLELLIERFIEEKQREK